MTPASAACARRPALAHAALAALLAVTLASCSSPENKPAQQPPPQETAGEERFKGIDSPGMRFLPRLEEAPGWQLEGDPLVYPAAAIASYLDQDAGLFARYEVVDVTVGKYRHPSTGGFATVEIFRFPDFVKSFGAYSSRREGVQGPLEIQNESFAGKRSVHIWRGPFYVRILGGPSEATRAGMVVLAQTVADRMPAAPGLPAVFRFFPENFRVPRSERFLAEPVFGQPFLSGGFTATFNVMGSEIEGVILPARDKAGAAKILDQFESFFAANGKLLDPVPNLGEDNFTAEDRTFGRTAALRIDRFVIAFRGFTPRQQLIELAIATDQRILNSIRRQLVATDKARAAAARRPPQEQPQEPPIPSTIPTGTQ